MVAYCLQCKFINILVIQCLRNEDWYKVTGIAMKLLKFLSSSLTWSCDCNVKQVKVFEASAMMNSYFSLSLSFVTFSDTWNVCSIIWKLTDGGKNAVCSLHSWCKVPLYLVVTCLHLINKNLFHSCIYTRCKIKCLSLIFSICDMMLPSSLQKLLLWIWKIQIHWNVELSLFKK